MAATKKSSKVTKPSKAAPAKAAKKPAAKAPAKAPAKKPAAKPAKPAAKAPAKKPVAKAPVKKPAVKAPAKKPVAAAKVAAPKKVEKVVAAPKATDPVPPKKVQLAKPKNDTQYTQSELFESIKNYCGFEKTKEAKAFYDSFCTLVHGALKAGYKLNLPGLGKLMVRKTKARTGINPFTKQPINIPAKKKIAFRPLRVFKEAVL